MGHIYCLQLRHAARPLQVKRQDTVASLWLNLTDKDNTCLLGLRSSVIAPQVHTWLRVKPLNGNICC